MSFEFTQAEVQGYSANVIHLAQQKESKLRPYVRTKPGGTGINLYFDRIGATGTTTRTERYGPTKIINTPHSRRRLSFNIEDWNEFVDQGDEELALMDPASEYTKSASMAFGRTTDDYIIDGMLGTSYSNTDGQTAVAFPSAQVVSDAALNNITSLDEGSTDSGQMSPQRVLQVVQLFDSADVEEDDRYLVWSPVAKQSFLSHVPSTSRDFVAAQALVEGRVDNWGALKIITSTRLPTASQTGGPPNRINYLNWASGWNPSGTRATDRICIAWSREGVGFATHGDLTSEAQKNPERNMALTLHSQIQMAATRIEEARVIAVPVQLS